MNTNKCGLVTQHCPFARLLPLPLPVFRSLSTGEGDGERLQVAKIAAQKASASWTNRATLS
jgi:hypothetical protein